MSLIIAGAAGCASGGGVPEGMKLGADTSELAVREFLQGANLEDYYTMGSLFGTADGSAIDRFGLADVEQRMRYLSTLLKHREFELRTANLPTLGPERVRYVARMRGTRHGTVDVPIVTVPHRHRWFVEKLEIEVLAGGG